MTVCVHRERRVVPTDTETVPNRRGRPRSIETERAVLEGAYALMAAEGLAATTIDAVARNTGVSKVTIYKWWPSREALLIDAFLRKASSLLPMPHEGDPVSLLRSHAGAYAEALNGEFGRVQLAVVAECIAKTGSGRLFAERYLDVRRNIGVRIIRAGQRTGRIAATRSAEELYDQIYGTLFYQFTFGLRRLSAAHARSLVSAVLASG
ncbi:MAG: TetR/AcrR family transcriptional regulator [Proteobacteria bacterium]|nr:TetR/AcrR family transcriptional regulator [Pseudomonadota bacterium]